MIYIRSQFQFQPQFTSDLVEIYILIDKKCKEQNMYSIFNFYFIQLK